MPDQYAFIYPGEKLYVLVAGVNGSNDYIHVVQVTFPTQEEDGRTIIDGSAKSAIEFNAQYDLLESNDAANLTSDGTPVVDAYAEQHRKQGGKGRVGMTPMRPLWKTV